MSRFKTAKKGSVIKPYYVESFTDFSWVGINIPTNLAPYAGGNYFLGISGNMGDTFVTVASGTIADAGTTKKWAGVIKDDAGNWTPYLVTGTDGVNKVNIYPALKGNITAGEIANLHDAASGQHYTERGYFALAQHIYKALTRFSERNKYVTKFRGTDLATNSPWVRIGAPNLGYNVAFGPSGVDGQLRSYTSKTFSITCFANGTTQGVEWEVNVFGKRGFLETFAGLSDETELLTAEFYLDGVLVNTVSNFGKVAKRLTFEFKDATTAKVRIFILNNSVQRSIKVSDTTWWLSEKQNFQQLEIYQKLLLPYSKVVYLGDSWGFYHTRAISRELARLLTNDTGSSITVVNPSVGGMTSAWGKAWFDEYVIQEKPTHVIIEFFVNDYNSGNGSTYGNYTAPDGSSKPLTVTKEQWRQNIRDMVNTAIRNGIQPIVLCPSSTASVSQAQGLTDYNVYLTEGALFN